MIDRKKLTIGLITSMVTILIYLDQQKCGSVVIILSLLLTFFVSLKTKDQRKNKWSLLKRGRDKSRLGLRNWRENRLGQKCFLLLSHAFFLRFPKKLTFGRRLFESLQQTWFLDLSPIRFCELRKKANLDAHVENFWIGKLFST